MKVEIGPYPDNGDDERTEDIRIDDYDTFDVGQTLATIAVPLLKRFLDKDKQGIPSNMLPDSSGRYNEDGLWEEYTEDEYKEAEDKWNRTLGEMIWALDQCVHEADRPEFPDNFSSMGDEQRAAVRGDHTAYEKRVQDGLELFGKHFQSLWW